MEVDSASKPFANRFFEMAAEGSLFELYDQMLGEVDISKVLEKTTAVVKQIFDSERATVFRVLPETQELESIFVIGNVARKIRVPITDKSLAGYCAFSKKSFVVADAYCDLSDINPNLVFDKSWDRINKYRTRDVMCSPILFKGKLVGVVQVINSRSIPLHERNIPLLESIARFLAYSLYHTHIYEELRSLKHLEREKAEFMRVIVEGFTDPLVDSKKVVSALQETNMKNTALLFGLDKIEGRLNELSQLLKDVGYLSQVKSGSPFSDVVVFDLRTDTSLIYNNFLDSAELNEVEMVISTSDSPLNVRLDRQAFHLILSNVLSNAVKYSEGGTVNLNLNRENAFATIVIEDTGIGIPPDEIPDLFREFVRASNARQSGIEGTGIGLVIVKELTERFNGEIEIESTLNEGTTFTLRLPLYEE